MTAESVSIPLIAGATPPVQSTPTPSPQSNAGETAQPTATQAPMAPVTFAVIGDYGEAGSTEAAVAQLVLGWKPDFIVSVGDNNYLTGAQATIDANIGQYFHSFIFPYKGKYGPGADTNRFWPALGNHDWLSDGAKPYLDYFTLPGNERYYDVEQGPAHLFILDTDPNEPDGITSTSTQAAWLRATLKASTSCWNLVVEHHPPYSSGDVHGSNKTLQWPFGPWGADAVLSGHEHTYERIMVGGIPYFVNGLGAITRYSFTKPVPGSTVRYNGNYGAMRVTATTTRITYQFITIDGKVIDTYEQAGGCQQPAAKSGN